MSSIWTLTVDGSTRPLADWGIDALTLTRRSFDKDELNFTVKAADCLAALAFAYDTEVTLQMDNSVRFRGKIRFRSSAGSARTETIQFSAWNAWDNLETTVYEQQRVIVDQNFQNPSPQLTTDVVFFRNPAFNDPPGWVPWTNVDQINDLLSFALSQASGLSFSVSCVTVQPPWGEGRDVTIASALRRCAAWTPDMVSWVTYSLSGQTLHICRRAGAVTASIDLTAASQVEDFSIKRRDDLIPTGVVFFILTTETNPADQKTYIRRTISSIGMTDGPRVIKETIDLTNLENDAGAITSVPIGGVYFLAADYYWALNSPTLDGSIRLRAADCPGTWNPGMRLSFLNGGPLCSGADGMIAEIVESPFEGKTEIRFTPFGRLSGNDFARLLLSNKINHKDFPGAPGAPGAPGKRGADGTGQGGGGGGVPISLDLCDGTTVRVQGAGS
jgi:hypothetical protein